MLSIKLIFILAVLLVNTVYCQKENDSKGVLVFKSEDPNAPPVVNGVTENNIPEGTTVTETDGNETTTVDPTTTSQKPITTTTEAPITTTNATTTTTSTTTQSTTTTVKPPTSSPLPTSTTTPDPPKDRHFDGASFIGGIILAVGLMGIGVIAFKYYKARTERNYHTL